MLKKNNFLFGILIGLILPGLVFVGTEVLKKDMRILGKENVFYLLGLAINLFLVRYYFKAEKEDSARGLVLATFLAAFSLFYYKSQQ